jgi:hypothetical protein
MAALTLPEPAGRWGVVGARSIIRGCGRGKPSDVRCGRRRDNNITTWDPHGFNLEVALDVVLTGEESPRSNLHKKSVDRALVVVYSPRTVRSAIAYGPEMDLTIS